MIRELGTAPLLDSRPAATLRQSQPLLIRHLEKEEVGDLLDVVAVIDAVVPECMAEAPKFLNYIGHAAIASLSCTTIFCSRASPNVRFAAPQPPASESAGTMSKWSC